MQRFFCFCSNSKWICSLLKLSISGNVYKKKKERKQIFFLSVSQPHTRLSLHVSGKRTALTEVDVVAHKNFPKHSSFKLAVLYPKPTNNTWKACFCVNACTAQAPVCRAPASLQSEAELITIGSTFNITRRHEDVQFEGVSLWNSLSSIPATKDVFSTHKKMHKILKTFTMSPYRHVIWAEVMKTT